VQIPGYVQNQEALKDAGIDEILIVSVNDGAVMRAWFVDQKLNNTMIQMMGDPFSEFSKACGIELLHEGPIRKGLIGRSKRVAMIVIKNIIQYVAISESVDDPAGDDDPSATCHEAIIHVCNNVLQLKKQKTNE
jgi:glutaredoxin/glutathione-dependent peroxiredoxin